MSPAKLSAVSNIRVNLPPRPSSAWLRFRGYEDGLTVVGNMRQLAVLKTYLASFPSMDVYRLDHFALRTGETIDGQDVYDLVAAAGLNY